MTLDTVRTAIRCSRAPACKKPPQLLASLGLERENPGAFAGPGSQTPAAPSSESINPAPARASAAWHGRRRRLPALHQDHRRSLSRHWRPGRRPSGEVVRQLCQRPARHKTASASCHPRVGTVLSEGLGEVQEMIEWPTRRRHVAPALRASKYALGAAAAPLYEQWLPLGPVGYITAFNFPVDGVGVETRWWPPSAATRAVEAVGPRRRSRPGGDEIAQRCWRRTTSAAHLQQVRGPIEEVSEKMYADQPLPPHPGHHFRCRWPPRRHSGGAAAGPHPPRARRQQRIVVMNDADLDLALRAVLFAAVGTPPSSAARPAAAALLQKGSPRDEAAPVAAYGSIRIGDRWSRRR